MSKTITIINNKPRIRLAYLFISIISELFGKKEPSFQKSLLSEGTVIFGGRRGGALLSGVVNTCEIVSLLSGGRYFRNFTVVSYRKRLSVLLR